MKILFEFCCGFSPCSGGFSDFCSLVSLENKHLWITIIFMLSDPIIIIIAH